MLKTETRNPRTTHIDQMDTISMLTAMETENYNALRAVDAALKSIAAATEAISDTFRKGGRLIYAGAGTSGRLGVLDASECPPTFGVSPDQVIGLIAGGDRALRYAVEGFEDSESAGKKDAADIGILNNDIVVGISAAGGAAYVKGVLQYAKEHKAITVCIVNNPETVLEKLADIPIILDTGAEAITGSTRMKAGTAQKIVLNLLSTGAMIQTGKVYENLMINVRPSNKKLRARCIRILCDITGADAAAAEQALDQANGSIRDAISLL